MRWIGFTAILSVFFIQCEPSMYETRVVDGEQAHVAMKKLTDVIVHDIFSPPQASRIYVYPSIAAYETMRHAYPEYRSLVGQLTELGTLPAPMDGMNYDFGVASVQAFLVVGKALIFSEAKIDAYRSEWLQSLQDKEIPKRIVERSIAYGDEVARTILDWADQDMYKQTRTYPKFSITDEPSRWKPTPPDYMEGIEPHWREIRPFVIDSANQFIPAPPPPFDMSERSDFYAKTVEVYETVNQAGDEEVAIARFWDCNPYVSHHTGHVMYATKKITPGGHWVGIAAIAARKENLDLMASWNTYVWTTIALADGFISCWDEKYRSSLIRPETVINQYIDEDWQPVLQTPPFPEHTSGHSVISAAASVALTHVFGESFSYIDSVEVEYGLPPRSFGSFSEAAEEAAISRLYGGIHYMPAITDGVRQGRELGDFIVKNLETKK